MSDPEVHIAAWEAAGLIDAPLAARLREASRGIPGEPSVGQPSAAEPPAATSPTSAGSFFGPIVTIGEVFAYLGAAFLLGAWIAFIGTLVAGSHPDAVLTGGMTLAALITFGIGVFLARGDSRRRRGAGVAFLTTTFLAAGAAAFLVQMDVLRNTLQGQAPGVLIALVAVTVAAGLRRLLPAVITQFGLLVAFAGLAGAILSWFQSVVFPTNPGDGPCCPQPTPEPVSLLIVGAAWWLLAALGLGLLAIAEARQADADPAAGRRVALTRFSAGLVAVAGVASSLAQSGYRGNDTYGRILEPWLADLAILAVALVLVERAFRRDSTAFILAAAIGLIIALTDFNFSYLAQSTYIGLLIEGVILLAVGFGGDGLRRRLSAGESGRRQAV
jgi:hypothetical protein